MGRVWELFSVSMYFCVGFARAPASWRVPSVALWLVGAVCYLIWAPPAWPLTPNERLGAAPAIESDANFDAMKMHTPTF